MANPLPNETQIYEQIKRENLTIDPVVWELVNHHIRNDMNVISIATGNLGFEPSWILRIASFVIKFLHIISRQPGKPPIDIKRTCGFILENTRNVDNFLKTLHRATEGGGT